MFNQVLPISIRLGTSVPFGVTPGCNSRARAKAPRQKSFTRNRNKVILVIIFLTVWNHRNSKKRLFSDP